MTDRVLVIGGTGRVGREVVAQLAGRVAVRVLSRRATGSDTTGNVETVTGDLTVPSSLDRALDDVASVFLVWTAAPATVEDVVRRIASKARRLVLLSSPHQTPHPFFQQPNPMARFHAELDRIVRTAAIPSTIVRPGMFASNTRMWWQDMIRAGDVVRWPYGQAETAPIDERDIAAVAAAALVDDRHSGGDYVLTGPESLSQAEQVQMIGTAIGRKLTFEELSPEAFRQQTAGIWPPAAVEMLLAAWSATLGHRAYVTSTVEEVTGTPARTFRHWADRAWCSHRRKGEGLTGERRNISG